MSRKGLGMTVIAGTDDVVIGVFTDGDLRRALDRQIDVHRVTMREVMTTPCKTIGPQELAAERCTAWSCTASRLCRSPMPRGAWSAR
ncbi:polysialic acid capsule expression protein [mine drainage metagenome]|uniref:Polysialic acid capsule expression protein n=1 Tax=mine drainage metagenome TaxID=410659 RepID=T0XYS8_9ZZZZ